MKVVGMCRMRDARRWIPDASTGRLRDCCSRVTPRADINVRPSKSISMGGHQPCSLRSREGIRWSRSSPAAGERSWGSIVCERNDRPLPARRARIGRYRHPRASP